ncbi:1-acyl-sn-glycerol-3-phosphate acyltransferase [Hondaea fermentalgiana]|uniref:1-acyl-sn-glycerol-3-phosphate acyltransferase n=1 Tax=Hondaea fermentalgiana TaxID=2315210 RepID=A0A2R5GXE6_9STRA|nr:1-acyl-sn-glycerol-3-phosphate acyltransferase [Hondaea fermentalgiana]|eukprot:GBG34458.1 1-acyl-sn-glycerol-3-phosphate acyltransferase [Hondaea fermentalgiana]
MAGRVVSVLATTYFFMSAVTAFVLAFLLQIICWITFAWMMPKYKRLRLMGRIFRSAALIFCVKLNPFWTVKVRRRHQWKGKLPQRAIYMSNHLTFADAFMLCAVFMPRTAVNFIAKAGVFQIPIAGWSLKIQGDLPVYFKKKPDGKWGIKPGTVGPMMDTVGRYLQNNIGICVFPEGTLSPTGVLKEFKPGFFDAAVKNKVPIVPLAMWGNHTAWPSDSWYMQPATIEIGIGEPLYPGENETKEALMARVRGAILDLRDNLPLYKRTPITPEVAAKASAMVAPSGEADVEQGSALDSANAAKADDSDDEFDQVPEL